MKEKDIEQEAVEALMSELGLNDEPNEPNLEQVADEPNEPQTEPTDEPNLDEPTEQTAQPQAQPNLEQIMQMLQELNARVQGGGANEPTTQPNLSQEATQNGDFETLKALGLADLATRLQAQETALAEQKASLEQKAKEAELRAEFDTNLAKFKSQFPTINPDDMSEWAIKNGYGDFLGSYKGWELTAMAMLNSSKPKTKPDPITSSNGNTGETNAFDKLKKGEVVNELELGAELLKFIS